MDKAHRVYGMKIAFYAPLKSPHHPVPSGDRQMARLLIRALELAGHQVDVISQLRSFHKDPADFAALQGEADKERLHLQEKWHDQPKPDLWLSYHVYYKSPDLLGPQLCRQWQIPYLTAEASYAEKRNHSGWQAQQQLVLAAVQQAAANIWFTRRDLQGLQKVSPQSHFFNLPPFIDVQPFAAILPRQGQNRLICVAMMRAGDKLASYQFLAKALQGMADRDWHLSLIGDGPARTAVEACFQGLDPRRLSWLGQTDGATVPGLLEKADIYVWPGIGEAYGIAYLEAQAAGLPVVALDIAGVPEVVDPDHGGFLTPADDVEAYAAAIDALLQDPHLIRQMGEAARRFVHEERSLPRAADRLQGLLNQVKENANG